MIKWIALLLFTATLLFSSVSTAASPEVLDLQVRADATDAEQAVQDDRLDAVELQADDLQVQLDLLEGATYVTVDSVGTEVGFFSLILIGDQLVTSRLLDGRYIVAYVRDFGFQGNPQEIAFETPDCSGQPYLGGGTPFNILAEFGNVIDSDTHYHLNGTKVYAILGPSVVINRLSQLPGDGSPCTSFSGAAVSNPIAFIEDLSLRFIPPFHAELR